MTYMDVVFLKYANRFFNTPQKLESNFSPLECELDLVTHF